MHILQYVFDPGDEFLRKKLNEWAQCTFNGADFKEYAKKYLQKPESGKNVIEILSDD